MATFYNRVWVGVASAPGTGTITLGSVISNAYCTAAEAGAQNGDILSYVLEDGNNFEIGIGTYSTAGTLTRTTVRLSKIAGTSGTSKIDAGANATVFLLPAREDLVSIGEYEADTVVTGSAVSLTNATPINLVTLSLTAGDWDVSALAQFNGNSATTVTALVGSLSLTSATLDATDTRLHIKPWANATLFNLVNPISVRVGPARFSLSAADDVHFVTQANFGVNSCTVFGTARARRVAI